MEDNDIKQAKITCAKEYTQKKFGENLLALMNAKDITQKELAQAVGITPASLSAYKNGTKSPTLPVAAAIARELGVSLDWLCDMDTTSEQKPENVTYSAVIQALVNLSNLADTRIEEPNNLEIAARECIYFEDPVLDHFLQEWKQVKGLLDNGTITRNLYEPWIAQQLKDYDCPLDEIPHKLNGIVEKNTDVQALFDSGKIPF